MKKLLFLTTICIVSFCVETIKAQNTYPWPSSGNIRIGTTHSDEVLNVKGNLLLDAFNYGEESGIFFRQEFSPNGAYHTETYLRNMSIRMKKLYHSYIDVMDISAYGGIIFGTAAQDRVFISQSGKVGIGTFDLTAELTVNGKIDCEEIEVKDISADHVFKKDYNLRSLEKVESFIKENGHLPDVAPANETVKGVKLSEFNSLLLQKIEELTLYIIEQDKKIEELQYRLNTR